ncbi:NAD-dependent epimerase/dehydratase family protein [Cryobacterium sp. PH31-AA6]|uniref:polysaccharide biosynthesis C-terminal domain-containing protein n=1 Tax=Cryobacterium sp. PH31-AA6 TaxID=3046205 RepID=UPI0024BBD36C|nr:NAD-dependent epimerase/dehydratase family protein [Cryobacterium sp. PH31-AA6]MDJ0323898.1 NAD-dependent epimerase/dehydratase family protein [Cryobacterium sp. PH31-AA6]
MQDVALTGANGFLGFHVRAALREHEVDARAISMGATYDQDSAIKSLDGSSRLIHLAGVNRGTDDEVREGNLRFASQIAEAVGCANVPPSTIVFANSTQSTNSSVYGDSKSTAADILRAAADSVGAEFQDVRLPNLFGEHGRPFYNSVTATFCQLLANGVQPSVDSDSELTLLHAQDAADLLIGATTTEEGKVLESRETVSGLLRRLTAMAANYNRGEIPDVAEDFSRNLFNTYRSFTFPKQAPVHLTRHADSRGSFFEIIRSHGGTGQSSFSTTAAGISRGSHFHRRKIERFTVLSGVGTISLRRLFSDEVLTFAVSGGEPAAIDMPTMWAHKITNTGAEPLFTSFWSNDIFNPEAPDTIAEAV